MQQTFLHPRPLFLLKENKPRRDVVCRLASRAPAVRAGRSLTQHSAAIAARSAGLGEGFAWRAGRCRETPPNFHLKT